MSAIKIAIADDHTLFRRGIKELLEGIAGHDVVLEAENGKVLLEKLESAQPDIILMDYKMPEMDGVQATKIVCQNYPKIRVIGLSMYNDNGYIMRMIRAGVTGYLLKDDEFDYVMHTIEQVRSKGEHFDEKTVQIMRRALIEVDSEQQPDPPADIEFSEKEIKVLRLSAEGLSAEEISKKIFLSRRTIETYRTRMVTRAKCKNMMELIAMALRNGWIK